MTTTHPASKEFRQPGIRYVPNSSLAAMVSEGCGKDGNASHARRMMARCRELGEWIRTVRLKGGRNQAPEIDGFNAAKLHRASVFAKKAKQRSNWPRVSDVSVTRNTVAHRRSLDQRTMVVGNKLATTGVADGWLRALGWILRIPMLIAESERFWKIDPSCSIRLQTVCGAVTLGCLRLYPRSSPFQAPSAQRIFLP
jgi:hypothetical protein